MQMGLLFVNEMLQIRICCKVTLPLMLNKLKLICAILFINNFVGALIDSSILNGSRKINPQ
jgi:hypothetical protein